MSLQSGCFCLLIIGVVVIGASAMTPRTGCNCTCPEKDPTTEWFEKLPKSCQETMAICILPFLPYTTLSETEIMDKVRTTPLSKHCKDFTKMGKCARRTMKGSSCTDVADDMSTKFLKILGIYDFTTNFICKKQFDKFNRSFPCLMSHDLETAIQRSCNATYTEMGNICEDIRKASGCASMSACALEVVKVDCGVEAATITRKLDDKLRDQMASIGLEMEDSTSKIANQLKRFMFRK